MLSVLAIILFSVCFSIILTEANKVTVLIIEKMNAIQNFLENPPLINIIPLDPVKYNLKCPKLLLDDMFGHDRLFHEFLMHSYPLRLRL